MNVSEGMSRSLIWSSMKSISLFGVIIVINVVVILQFEKLGWFNEEPYVSNSFDASRVFIDTNIDEINDFKNSLKSKFDGTGSKSELSLSNSLVLPAATLEVEFQEKHQFCTIADLSFLTEDKFNDDVDCLNVEKCEATRNVKLRFSQRMFYLLEIMPLKVDDFKKWW